MISYNQINTQCHLSIKVRLGLQVYDNQIYVYHNMKLIVQHKVANLSLIKEEHYKKALAKSLPKYPNIDNLAKQNLSVIGEVYKMNNSYQQLTTNLEYLKLKQMAQHLGKSLILVLITNCHSWKRLLSLQIMKLT